MSTDLLAVPGISSDNGDGMLFGAGSTMGPNWSGPSNPMIFARRTDTGWKLRSAIRSIDRGDRPLELGAHEAQSGWLTRDGREFVFGAKDLGAAPVPPTGILAGIFRSLDAPEPPDWLSAPNVGAAAAGVDMTTVSAGADTGTVAFQSTAPLTSDAPPSGTRAVYVRRGGELRLASIAPNGTGFSTNASLANSGVGHTPQGAPSISMRNQVAGNGRYVLFIVGGNANEGPLYVRDLDAGVTRQLAGGGTGIPDDAMQLRDSWGGSSGSSSIQIDNNTVPQGTVFAARDAARAFFHRSAGVGQTPVVYEADLETGAVVSRAGITGPPLGLSADGRHMLFIEVPAGAPGGTGGNPPGDWTLRYWSADSPSTSVAIGTIEVSGSRPYGLARVYRSSEDGRTWVFTATGSPDPARPNVAPQTHQLYRWTVGDAAPTCLTCEPIDGVARTSGVSLTVQESISSEGFLTPTTASTTNVNKGKMRLAQVGHSVSDDGRWILFDSPDQLVPEDQNVVRDVYLWDRDAVPSDRLQLVTSGSGMTPSFALDLDPAGKNAFFSTREGLLPDEDDDNSYDVYTARIDGGFPKAPQPCSGEACRPPVIPDPPQGLIASSVLRDVPVGPKQAVQQGTPKLRIRSVRTSSRRLTVRVDTPKAGKIRVSGKQLRTTNRTAKRATTYTLRVPLSASTKRRVARGRTVKVKVQVRFTPSGSKKASSVSSSVSVKKGR